MIRDRVGEGRSIGSLSELDGYPGNTFVSGAGYFSSSSEAASLVRRKHLIRFDLPDDVAVGLMLERHEVLPGFSMRLERQTPISQIAHRLRHGTACHGRIARFRLNEAEELWEELRAMEVWRL